MLKVAISSTMLEHLQKSIDAEYIAKGCVASLLAAPLGFQLDSLTLQVFGCFAVFGQVDSIVHILLTTRRAIENAASPGAAEGSGAVGCLGVFLAACSAR